jgi:hypothetical protein
MSAEELLTSDELGEQIEEGGIAAFREVECTREQGGEEVVDLEKIAKGIFPLVLAARVDSLDERASGAITKGDLTARFLPELIGPDDEEWDAVGEVGHGIWAWCEARAKKLTLCHTKISVNSMLLPAVYVTADLECIKQDFGLPLKTSVRNAANKLAKNIAATIETHPEYAKALAKEVESGMKNATQLAKAMLALSAGEPEDE